MNVDDLLSSLAASPPAAVVEEDINVTASRLRVEETQEHPADDMELAELLARLDGADTVASEVEAKLDGILGTLDNLLSTLEPKDSDKPQEATTSPSERSPSYPS
ncbi:hypothetical protein JVU11DRAFT_4698 [Chiua virens]|nr:hypothetical protein JVU11DRAFT_4698 [Chiua virens]